MHEPLMVYFMHEPKSNHELNNVIIISHKNAGRALFWILNLWRDS